MNKDSALQKVEELLGLDYRNTCLFKMFEEILELVKSNKNWMVLSSDNPSLRHLGYTVYRLFQKNREPYEETHHFHVTLEELKNDEMPMPAFMRTALGRAKAAAWLQKGKNPFYQPGVL